MWTKDENNEPLWLDDPSPVEEVTIFFEKYGEYTVIDYHTLEDMYRIFRLRYDLEKEGHKFEPRRKS